MGEITDKAIDKLRKNPPTEGNTVLWDGGIRGFGARVTAAGVVSFVLEYRTKTEAKDADGVISESTTKRRYTIGRHPELSVDAARREALKLCETIRSGTDPLEIKKALRDAPTLETLCFEYQDSARFRAKRPSSKRNDRNMIDTVIRPKLGAKRALEIKRSHIEDLHEEMKATPYQANRVLSLLSVIFAFAIDRKVVSENPTRGIKKHQEEKREGWLTKEQMSALDDALNAFARTGFPNEKPHLSIRPNPDGANALRLLILTGARMGEVLKAEWSEFDLDRETWTKPSHHTKQKKTQTFPLNAPAVDLLKSMKQKGASGPLFPGRQRGSNGKKAQRSGGVVRVSLKRPWLQVSKAAGLVEEYLIPGKRKNPDGTLTMRKRYKPTARVHDLRHSYASYLVSHGVPLHVVGSLLGHTQAATTQRYAHAHDDARRAATNKLADVLPFKKAI